MEDADDVTAIAGASCAAGSIGDLRINIRSLTQPASFRLLGKEEAYAPTVKPDFARDGSGAFSPRLRLITAPWFSGLRGSPVALCGCG